jgi:hypothetical protein
MSNKNNVHFHHKFASIAKMIRMIAMATIMVFSLDVLDDCFFNLINLRVFLA